MAEELLRRRLADAYDPGPGFPDPMLLSRAMAALEPADHTRARRRTPARRLAFGGPGRKLMALALIVLLMIAAAGAFIAIQHFVPQASTVWSGCGGEFQCTTVKVPLDYSKPGAGSIDLAVIRKPATNPAKRIGALLLGGPPTGVDSLRMNSVFYGSLNSRFDLVGFDERGFGRSKPIQCLSDAQADALNEVDTVLDDAREKQVFIQAAQALAQVCQEKSGGMLPFAGTANDARDVDAIRLALGDQKLTFLGFSYATLLGETYAHLYPSHIRALVLDGVVDPTLSATDAWRERAAGYEANLQAFLANCRAVAGCLLAQHGDPGVQLARLMQALDEKPLRVDSRTLSRSLAITGLMFGLDPHNWNALDAALFAAANEDVSPLLGLADLFNGRRQDGTYLVNADALTAQYCADTSVSSDVPFYDQLGPAMSQASPIFGPAFQYVPLECAYWPVKPSSTPGPISVQGAPPILLIAGTHDPYYSLVDAQSVHQQIAGSRLLTRNGYGFLSYFNSLCVRLAVGSFLTQLTLPADGAVCESDYPA